MTKHQHTFQVKVNNKAQTKTEFIFGHIHGAPVYTTIFANTWLFVWPEMDNLKQFMWQANRFVTPAGAQSTVKPFEGMPGGMLSISSAGPAAFGTGIVWATHPAEDAWAPDQASGLQLSVPKPIPGILYAFDATDVSHNLWNSDMHLTDKLGEFSKFAPPTIANGRVYVATFSGQLQVYGLCGTPSICVGGSPAKMPLGSPQ